MDASGARSEISLWDLGRRAYVPGGVGFVDQLRVRLDELLRLVHVAVRGSFPDVVHGLLLGLAGLSSHDDDLPAQFFGTSRLGGLVDRGTRDPTASRAVAVHRRLPCDHRAVGRSRRSRGVPSPLSPRLSAGSVSCRLDARETCSHLQLINDRDSPFRRCLLDRRLKARDGETRESFQSA